MSNTLNSLAEVRIGQLEKEVSGLQHEITIVRKLNRELCDRVEQQAEILRRSAERAPSRADSICPLKTSVNESDEASFVSHPRPTIYTPLDCDRCPICGWPMAWTPGEGCRPGEVRQG